MKIQFKGYKISPQYLRSDESYRVTIDVSQDQLENIKDILLKRLPNGIYNIEITPDIEEITK